MARARNGAGAGGERRGGVWPQGTLKIDFKKHDAPSAGATAGETGSITFTPSATAPDSNDIRFFQIARTIDTTTGKQFNWTGTSEANRQKVMTKGGAAKNVAAGFFVDEIYAALNPRTKAADPAVPSSYGAGFMPPGTSFGKKKGTTIVPASLTDTPNHNAPLQFNLVSTARGETGIVYGTVLWGFETFNDKTGTTKVKNEYHKFRISAGETFDEAERVYNEFMRNPGSSTARKR